MPATAKRNQGKTEFVRSVLDRNPYANARIVREEWAAAGHADSISQTLINKQRSAMGLTGNIKGGRPKKSDSAGAARPAYKGKKRGRKPKPAGVAVAGASGNGRSFDASKVKAGARPAQLSQIEAEIDRLLFRVMSLGGMENIEDSLRRTRRLLYQTLPGGQG
jgi:hypothetical protein